VNRVAWVVCASWMIACAESGERAPARAPGSSEAEEAPPRPIATSLAHDPLSEHQPDPEHHADSSIYTCPMHPEVQQAGPGECPKCGMKLVPKSPSTSPEAKPRHEHAN
jgi:hypothetical protein